MIIVVVMVVDSCNQAEAQDHYKFHQISLKPKSESSPFCLALCVVTGLVPDYDHPSLVPSSLAHPPRIMVDPVRWSQLPKKLTYMKKIISLCCNVNVKIKASSSSGDEAGPQFSNKGLGLVVSLHPYPCLRFQTGSSDQNNMARR